MMANSIYHFLICDVDLKAANRPNTQNTGSDGGVGGDSGREETKNSTHHIMNGAQTNKWL